MSSFLNSTTEESIKVLVRLKPNDSLSSHIKVNKNSILTSNGKCYTYDYVETEDATQEDIFDRCYGLFQSFIDGYNGTIFAYGQTGSGKTYTMTGISDAHGNTEQPGLIPKGLQHIFNKISEKESDNQVEYLIKCSFVEIYNEQVYDLLDKTQQRLNIRVNIKQEVYIEPLNEIIIESPRDAVKILQTGLSNRHVASTAMNRESSRSHAVFSIILESRKKQNGIDDIRRSCLHLVDLAGSERQRDTKTEGVRLKEAVNINQSLLTLGHVMRNLAEAKGKNRYISYRQSKLTLILKDAIGGNSKAILVACIHPNSKYLSDTLKTLAFANNAKNIKNKAKINVDVHGDVESLTQEVKRLREIINSTICFSPISISDMQEDSLWKSKFVNAMIIRSCTIYNEEYLNNENVILKNRKEELENINSNLSSQRFKLINELKDKISNNDEFDKVSNELINILNELLTIFRNMSDPYDRYKVDILNGEIRKLNNELELVKSLSNVSQQTLINNAYEDYNKLVKDENLNLRIKSLSKFAPDVIKLQEELNKANQTIVNLQQKEIKMKFNFFEEKSQFEKDIFNLRNKYKAGEEYVNKVDKVNRRLTTMFGAGNNKGNAKMEVFTSRNSRLRNTKNDGDLINFNVNKEEIEKNIKLKEEKRELKKKYDELMEKYDDTIGFKEKYESLKLEYESKQMKMNENEITIKQLNKDKATILQTKDKKIESLYEQIASLKSNLDDLELEMGNLKEQNAVLFEENECLKTKNEENINECIYLQTQQETLTLTQRESQQEINKYRDQMDKMKQENIELRETNSYLTQQWQDKIQEANTYLSQIENYESEINTKIEEHEKLINELKEVKLKLTNIEEVHKYKLNDIEEKMNQLKDDHKMSIEILKYQKSDLEMKLQHLENALENQRELHSKSLNDSCMKLTVIEEEMDKENQCDSSYLIQSMYEQMDQSNQKMIQANHQECLINEWLEEIFNKFEITDKIYLERNLENITSRLEYYRNFSDKNASELLKAKDIIECQTKKLNDIQKDYEKMKSEKELLIQQNDELSQSLGHNNPRQRIRLMDRYKQELARLNQLIDNHKSMMIDVDVCLRTNNLIHILEQNNINLKDAINTVRV